MTVPVPQPQDTGAREEPTLGAVLRRAAARLSDVHVAILSSLGLLGTVASLWLVRSTRLAALSFAAACFGGWALTLRSIRPGAPHRNLLRLLQVLLAVAGVAAVFAFGLSMLTSALGTWIS